MVLVVMLLLVLVLVVLVVLVVGSACAHEPVCVCARTADNPVRELDDHRVRANLRMSARACSVCARTFAPPARDLDDHDVIILFARG